MLWQQTKEKKGFCSLQKQIDVVNGSIALNHQQILPKPKLSHYSLGKLQVTRKSSDTCACV
jgi:hypothetical protein